MTTTITRTVRHRTSNLTLSSHSQCRFRVCDVPCRYGPAVPEKLLHCLWYDRRFDASRLRTRDGRAVRVRAPGLWNLAGGGPDFRHAEVWIGDALVRGDVEIHRRVSDWRAHGHDRDPAYSGVILHVALEGGTGADGTRTADGRGVPECVLGEALSQPIGVLSREIEAEDYPEASFAGTGRCYAILAARPSEEERLPALLAAAGRARLEMKAERWSALARKIGPEAAFVRGVARALGYRKNAGAFERLADAVPPALVARWREALPSDELAEGLTAALLDVAGLLPWGAPRQRRTEPNSWGAPRRRRTGTSPSPPGDGESDPATTALRDRYDEALGRLCATARPRFRLARSDWRLDGLRPTNSPERRIAGLASLLAGWPSVGRAEGLVACLRGALRGGGEPCARREPSMPGSPQEDPFALSEVAAGDRVEGRRARKLWLTLATEFLTPLDGYWAWRSTFGARPFRRPCRAIGPERAHAIVTNAVLPMALATARSTGDDRLAESVLALWQAAPPPRPDFPSRFVAARMFGPNGDRADRLSGAAARQGALLLFEKWCDSGWSGCATCPLAEAMEGGR